MNGIRTQWRRLWGMAIGAGLMAWVGFHSQVRVAEAAAAGSWAEYAGGADGSQYSPLRQVNKSNVAQLQQVWFYPAPSNAGRFGYNPLIVDGTMYVLGTGNAIIALDATTGKELWKHGNEFAPTNRGINYWENSARSDRRLIFSAGSYLQEVDARTGVTIPSFGNDGRVNLREGLDRDPRSIGNIQSGTPGHVFENLIILGSATGEDYGSPPGDIRAYNVLTGALAWTFHTVPRPAEFGYDTWPPEAWKYIGGTNNWGEMSIDTRRGIVYIPTGSPTYDFYGANRIGANLFSDCLVALDARTGKRLWHFQFVHHDLWDFDAVTGPKLITVKHNGKTVDAVAQATKQGFLFVFDRVSGEPLWPIEERKVPQTNMPGEKSWPTQPFPTKPPAFARQNMAVADVNPYLDPTDKAEWEGIMRNARNEGLFTPPSMINTLQIPGNNGGGNWGGAAADPENGLVFVMSKDAPTMLKMSQQRARGGNNQGNPAQQGFGLYAERCQTCHGVDRLGHAGVSPALVDAPKTLGADGIKTVVKSGRGEMPPFADLTAQNLDALAAYLADPAAGERLVVQQGRGPAPSVAGPATPGDKFFTGYGTMDGKNGLPAIGPPWSNLTAYDLNEGIIKWKIPLGTVLSLAEKGIKDTGSYWPRGGPVVTAGGLVFAGTGSDLTAHAYDKDTGKILWEKQLNSGPEGIPSVFEVNGRQYVVFCARSGRVNDNLPANPNSIAQKVGAPEAQGYYAFALPIAK